ncbi:Solute carrier family 35 member F2 [Picochlorum sp. SENEW3]|nr:Solute carrier family 35 member F2 [Picochlorum sp. SENEW3]WPT14862.1 Solute carrier family 35 member F2 [Picochlorum sp. SENEW3]
MSAQVRAILLSQLLSILIAVTSTCAAILSSSSVYCPALLSCCTYLLLFVVYKFFVTDTSNEESSYEWWKYAILALMDVEANYLVVMAFQKTSMTSVALLDQFSIPVAVILTKVLGLATYKIGHGIGVCLCIGGLSLLIISDSNGEAASHEHSLFGDCLVLIGASLYGAANVLQESFLRDIHWKTLLGNLGLWGSLISGIQFLALELKIVISSHWSAILVAYIVGFALAMFIFYSTIPFVLQQGGSTLLNIGLLSSDLYILLIRILLFEVTMTEVVIFAVSFGFVCSGIVLYSRTGNAKTALHEGDEEHTVLYSPVAGQSAEADALEIHRVSSV